MSILSDAQWFAVRHRRNGLAMFLKKRAVFEFAFQITVSASAYGHGNGQRVRHSAIHKVPFHSVPPYDEEEHQVSCREAESL